MTSPRPRPGRPTPPHIKSEAALVGALTAFAKSPPSAVSPASQPHRAPQHGGRPSPRPPTADLQVPPKEKTRQDGTMPARQGPARPARHDSGAAHILRDKGNSSGRDKSPETNSDGPDAKDHTRPPPVRKTRPRQLADQSGAPASASRTRPITTTVDTRLDGDAPNDTRTPSTSRLVEMFEKAGTRTASAEVQTPLKSPKPTRKSLVLSHDDSTISSQIVPRRDISYRSATSSPDRPPLTGDSGTTDLSSPTSFRSARDSFSPLQDATDSAKSNSAPPPRKPSRTVLPPLKTKPDLQSASVDVPRTAGPVPSKAVQSSPYTRHSATMSSTSIQASYNALHPRQVYALRTGDSLANAMVASSLASSRAPSPGKFHVEAQPSPSSHRHHRHHFLTRTPSPHKRKPASAGPATVMKQTLRKQNTASDDDHHDDNNTLDDDPYAKHKKKRHIRKHANKYNEGNRKRWRNAVTERERNRYEGVWAANRGLLLLDRPTVGPQQKRGGRGAATRPGTEDTAHTDTDGGGVTEDSGDDVSSLAPEDRYRDRVHAYVVRDIWSRSRLPAHVLEEIWNLVAVVDGGGSHGHGHGHDHDDDHDDDDDDEGRRRRSSSSSSSSPSLGREAFVVGMWLIDQRLRGRKLPVKVSESIWDSVRFLKGIRIRHAREKMAKVKK